MYLFLEGEKERVIYNSCSKCCLREQSPIPISYVADMIRRLSLAAQMLIMSLARLLKCSIKSTNEKYGWILLISSYKLITHDVTPLLLLICPRALCNVARYMQLNFLNTSIYIPDLLSVSSCVVQF